MRRSSRCGSRRDSRRSGSATSSSSPAETLWLFSCVEPFTRTRFAASSRSAAAREPTPSTVERKRSRRSPSASAGTLSRRLGKRLRSGPPRRRAPHARLALRRDERDEKRGDANDDERVGEVERRPVLEVEKVCHVADPQPVDEVPEASPDQEPERDREDRVPRARL